MVKVMPARGSGGSLSPTVSVQSTRMRPPRIRFASKDEVTPAGISAVSVAFFQSAQCFSICQPRSLSVGARQRLTRNIGATRSRVAGSSGTGCATNGFANWSCATTSGRPWGSKMPRTKRKVIASPSGASTVKSRTVSGAKPFTSRRPSLTILPSLVTIQCALSASRVEKR